MCNMYNILTEYFALLWMKGDNVPKKLKDCQSIAFI